MRERVYLNTECTPKAYTSQSDRGRIKLVIKRRKNDEFVQGPFHYLKKGIYLGDT